MRKQASITAAVLLAACLGAASAGSALAQSSSGKARVQQGYQRAEPTTKAATAPVEPAPSAAPEGAAVRWEPVLMVTSVEVIRSTRGSQLDIVRVRGLTSTDGWENPQLVPLTKGVPADGILDMLMVAQAPSEAMEPTGFSSVDAVFVFEADHPFKGIRVHGATNRVAMKAMPGFAEVPAVRNDCAKCVGKFFVAKGAAIPAGKSAADVVKEADLPTSLRVIKASEGIGKLETDPNRLTLLLDENGMIEIAVWD